MHSALFLYEYDQAAKASTGASALVGIDEAGRGPLAGPVVVAGVILPLESDSQLQVYDSKALTVAKRDELARELKATPGVRYAIEVISAQRIDEVNILRATHEGMRAVAQKLGADFALVDGLSVPRFPVPARFVVKGDATSASIATASILAKTTRDELLVALDAQYPEYGFASHKGYGTREHLEALRKHGPCPEHRRSFAPVRAVIDPPPIQLELPI